MTEGYIAFFDSGIGGLNLMAAFQRQYPRERCVYYGDNGNAPYGSKTEKEIAQLAERAFDRLTQYPIRAAAIACNTVTAECIESLRKRYLFPIVGMEPAVRPAAGVMKGGRILVLATPATLASERVKRLLARNGTDTKIAAVALDKLAGEVEKAAPDFERIRLAEHLPKGQFDAVVLGCTHYIYLKKQIEAAYRCPVFDGIIGTVDHLAKVANICLEKSSKIAKICPVFVGDSEKTNKTLYKALFLI